ncbi:MAG: DUF4105 domain-containing protein [Pirellulales bacterium]
MNQLYDTPEFYDTLTNNCTTNIRARRHVNRIAPNRVPYGREILLPGLSGQLAYNLGLLDRSVLLNWRDAQYTAGSPIPRLTRLLRQICR